jgi:hypothetical protein
LSLFFIVLFAMIDYHIMIELPPLTSLIGVSLQFCSTWHA